MMRIGFSPRKAQISLYIIAGFEHHKDLLDELGKHKTGKSCLYINHFKRHQAKGVIIKYIHYIYEIHAN